MKKFILIIFAILAFYLNVFSETNYPFEVKIYGQGSQNIIFIPGWGCSGDVWNETVKQLEGNNKCYVLTMKGFAGLKPETSPALMNWVQSIADYIKENEITKPVIIGHSIGGGMAMMLAAKYPSLISKIIVVDALPALGALNDTTFKAQENPDCSEYVKQFTSMNDEQFHLMQINSIPGLMNDTAHREQVVQWTVQSDRNTLAMIFCQYLNTDMREMISEITCPSLILLEGYFVNIKPLISEQYKNLKTAELKFATKGLHFVMYDDTQWYLDQIDNFLKF
ncbi:MAG: alpha/beta hydrolase [Ignavibacteria bacterium]|nr:alpha/beta hydrolase [Ignavibacteria bacterium]